MQGNNKKTDAETDAITKHMLLAKSLLLHKKNSFYANMRKTLVAIDVPKNVIGNERSKYLFGKILQHYERMWMILVCTSREMILLMLVYVCQHTDVTGDVSVGLSACRLYW